ncbi:sugar (pentulose or hexulose) kinase [Cryobacterium sp. CAN_C2]
MALNRPVVVGVDPSTQSRKVVSVDADTPVHDALLWNDVRSAPQAAALTEKYGASMWAGEVGVVPVAPFTITKLAWLPENRPELAARVERVLLPHDWLTWNILGRAAEATTDRSDASGTGYFSVPKKVTWSSRSAGAAPCSPTPPAASLPSSQPSTVPAPSWPRPA